MKETAKGPIESPLSADASEETLTDTKEVPAVSKQALCQDQLLRIQAEFANFQKRTEKEKKETLLFANKELIFQFLDILDSLELSLKHNKDKGVAIIHENMLEILKKQGLEEIDTTKKFNPEFHEALMQEVGKDKGTILEVFSKGYLLNQKLLRASKVKISTTSDDQ